jgi:UDP-N-acetylmuramoyl-L-alanyl-D-glutamate--2,6-diaminopimelate ligase
VELFLHLAAQGAMIERLSSDSRRCAPGVAFLAYPGTTADGRVHIDDAIKRGAAAVLWEEAEFSWRADWKLPNLPVRGLKELAGGLAHEFYGRPSQALWLCGVTGTNGKTSCSQWIAASLAARGAKAAVIGTLGSGFPGALATAVNTTPDALELHRMLSDFRAAGARAVAMEVSSHGLDQGRVNGVKFACALFTNLSHDHLDYHGSMQAYADAKARLFEAEGLATAVLNLDDALGVQLAQRLTERGVRTIGYSVGSVAKTNVREYLAALGGEIDSSWGRADLAVNQLGRFNVSNALGVLGCLLAYGIGFQDAAALLARLPAVPGRMQKIGDRPLVVIDYAHTPDALEKVLQALRPVAQSRRGRLLAMFGAGGDRDPAKRPLMGAVASRLADRVLLTSDNPRSEDPLAIIDAIRRGVTANFDIEPDRSRAIDRIIAEAAASDVVLIAGKGHESYQEIAGQRLPFSDEAQARAALARQGPR